MTAIDAPQALQELRTRPLMTLQLEVRAPAQLGLTPLGERRVGVITGGAFVGDRLHGRVLDGGSDWQTVRADGAWLIDCRLMLETHDGALIGMRYEGLRAGPPEVLARLGRGEPVDPAEYYFRITPTFETGYPAYAWINRLLAVGQGHRPPSGPIYTVFEVL